jgi:hypothetical protein
MNLGLPAGVLVVHLTVHSFYVFTSFSPGLLVVG